MRQLSESFTALLNYTQPWVWARNWVTMAKLKETAAVSDRLSPLSPTTNNFGLIKIKSASIKQQKIDWCRSFQFT